LRLKIELVNKYITINHLFREKIKDGYAFFVKHRFEDVPSGDTRYVLFENPSHSNIYAHFIAYIVKTLAELYIDLYYDVTITDNGSSLPVTTLYIGHGRMSKCRAEHSGAYSGGNYIGGDVIPGGNSVRAIGDVVVRAIGDVVEIGEEIIIPQNHNLLLAIMNHSDKTTSFGITLVWWEGENP